MSELELKTTKEPNDDFENEKFEATGQYRWAKDPEYETTDYLIGPDGEDLGAMFYDDVIKSDDLILANYPKHLNALLARVEELEAEVEANKQKAHDRARSNIAMLRGMWRRGEIDASARDYIIHCVSFDLLPEEPATNDKT